MRFRFTSRWLPEVQTASVSFLMSNFVLSLNLVRQDLLFLIAILVGESNSAVMLCVMGNYFNLYKTAQISLLTYAQSRAFHAAPYGIK